MNATRRASSSTMRTWRRSKSGDDGALNSTSTPRTRCAPCMTGQESTLNGTEPSGPAPVGPVRGHRLAVQLRPAEHVPVRAREHLGPRTRRRPGSGAAHRDVLVGDQQRTHAAAEVVHAGLHKLREIVGGFGPGRLFVRTRRAAARGRGRAPAGCVAGRRCCTGRRVRAAGTRARGRRSPCTNENGRAVPRCEDSRQTMPTAPSSCWSASRSRKT